MNFFRKKEKKTELHATPATPKEALPDIKETEFWELYELCKPFTMTSAERMYGLYNAVNYVLNNHVPGDFIECGVWKGGSALLMARMLARRGVVDRKVILYDTFEGMPEPTSNDKDLGGKSAKWHLEHSSIEEQESVWCYSSFDEVKNTLQLSGLSHENMVMIKGKVEDTIPHQLPASRIALLRLDTDWYESTLHELVHLYPLLVANGVLIIDDYGHWEGCRKAVDEYFSSQSHSLLLNRLDYTGRIAIKTISS